MEEHERRARPKSNLGGAAEVWSRLDIQLIKRDAMRSEFSGAVAGNYRILVRRCVQRRECHG